MSKRIIVGICGASGVIYGIRLLQALVENPIHISLLISRAGRLVLSHESDFDPDAPLESLKQLGAKLHEAAQLNVYGPNDWLAPPASGSFRHDGMVIAPCSMKTLAAVAGGLADTLLQRAADVCLKERRPLILVPRETPLNLIHLENMVRVCRAGAILLPAMPSFYTHPQTIPALVDTVTARILDHLAVQHQLAQEWGKVNIC